VAGEYHTPQPILAGETLLVGRFLFGVLAKGAGTLTLTDFDGGVLVDALPVVPGFNRVAMLYRSSADNMATLAGTDGTLLL
jgi:hypothetical protein